MRKRDVAGRRLGRLESEIMEFIWSQKGPVDIHDILSALKGRQRAYTTVMTIVTRLHEKGLVDRERLGRAFVYRASGSKEEIAARSLREVLASVDDPQAVLAHFVEHLQASPELLRRLRQLIRKQR